MKLIRTTAAYPDFQQLVRRLDQFLAGVNGDDHAVYHQFNGIDALPYVVVAYIDEKPVGCGACKPYDQYATEIKRMYVDPAQRNRGLGGGILAELEQWSIDLGFSGCVLETSVKLPSAVRLYAASGYDRIPAYGPYTDMPDSVCLRKELLRQHPD